MRHDEGQLRAALYDWHNQLAMKTQYNDIEYFIDRARCYSARTLLIVGCGTGRVACPLSEAGFDVTGMDIDHYRLARAASACPDVNLIEADIRMFRTELPFNLTVLPYSTAQLFPPSELEVMAVSVADCTSGPIIVDVSDHFSLRGDEDWHLVLQAYCPEFHLAVDEWQRTELKQDHCIISVRYSLGSDILESVDRWYFHPHHQIVSAFARAGLGLLRLDRGYGEDQSPHRRIYHVAGDRNLSSECSRGRA
jgi:trans-aconitate methyltransferase